MNNSLSLIKTIEDKPVTRTSINYFPLHKPGFRWAMMGLFVFVIIMANNFFYYQSRDDLAQSSLQKMGQVLKGQYESCLSVNEPERCRAILTKGIKDSWSYGKITILDNNGNTLLETENDIYKENRSVVVSDGEAGSGENKLSFVMSKRSSPPLYISSLRSMFLSIWEWPGQKDLPSYITNVAIKRSSPLFYALITIGLFFLMQTLADKQRNKLYNKIEAENFIFTNDLKSTREQLKSKMSRVEVLSEKIKSQEQSETRLLEDYYKEIDQLKTEIEESKERESKILADQEQRDLELSKLKPKEDVSQSKIIQALLFTNPNVPKRSEDFEFNDGIHHSRGFVEKIAKGIKKDELSSRLITKINSTAYNPAKLGQAILEWDRNKQIFVLNVYDHEDAGYGAEIVLSKDGAHSAYIAKYLVSGKNYLAKNGFSLKFGVLG